MEDKIFISIKGNKISILEEEISNDLGKTWQKTNNTKLDVDNIEYDSCDCSQTYEWIEDNEIEVNCQRHKSSILYFKEGCNEHKKTDYVKIGDLIDVVDDCEQKVFHKSFETADGKSEDWIWFENKWIKISC